MTHVHHQTGRKLARAAGCVALGLFLSGCATTDSILGSSLTDAGGPTTQPSADAQVAGAGSRANDTASEAQARTGRKASRTMEKVDRRTDSVIDRGLNRLFGDDE